MKKRQVMYFVHQCFAALNKYGLTPEELKTRMGLMADDLVEFELDDIGTAFEQWRRAQSTVPTPADIIQICNRLRSERVQSKPRWKPEITFTQVIREKTPQYNGQILAEFSHGNYKSQIALDEMFSPLHVQISYRRDQEL